MSRTVPPGSPSGVTPDWLSRVLRASLVPDETEVAGVDVEVIGEDRGFTGVVARLILHYNSPVSGAPGSLAAKFPLAERAGSTSYREHMQSGPQRARRYVEGCAREVHFYRLAGGYSLQIPRSYFGHADIEAGEIVLLLEDLTAAVPGDALAGCSVEEARSALTGMAGVHSRWWGDAGLEELNWLADWASGNPDRAERYRRNSMLAVERYGERLGPGVVELILGLREHLPRILDGLAAAPVTLVHGDLHLDNVMFTPPEDASVASIIDWQSVTPGPALVDVAGFLAESLSIEDRRAHEFELLREYHEAFGETVQSQYPFDRLTGDYLRGLTVRFAGVVGWLARVQIDDLEGRERALVEAIFEPGNVLAAAVDHRIVDSLGLET